MIVTVRRGVESRNSLGLKALGSLKGKKERANNVFVWQLTGKAVANICQERPVSMTGSETV